MERGKGALYNLGTGVKNDLAGNKLKPNVVFDPFVSCYSCSFEQPTSGPLKNITGGEPEGYVDNDLGANRKHDVHARFENTLYGYFLGKKVAYPVVERWTECYRHSFWHPRYVRFVYYNHMCKILGRMHYARALVDIRVDLALKETMVILVPNPVDNGVTMYTIKVEYEWKPSRCGTSLVFGHDDTQCPKRVVVDLRNLRKQRGRVFVLLMLANMGREEDNGTHMDDLVEGTKKKVGASSKTTGTWLGRKRECYSESRFTSPNPFDLLTKDDGNSMLRGLQESDNDPDEEDVSDETAHSSKSLGLDLLVNEDPMAELKNLRLASLQEATVAMIKQKNTPLLPTPRPVSNWNTQNKYPSSETSGQKKLLSQKEFAEKRAKNLCFYCDKKYVPGHKCEGQMFALEIKGMKGEECLKEDKSDLIEYELSKTPHISLKALSGVPTHNTMRVKGHGVLFTTDVMLLPLGGCELVLGVQWLSTFRTIQWNFKELRMQFEYEGQNVSATLHLTHYNEGQASDMDEDLKQLLEEYADVFTMPIELPPYRSFDHKIPLIIDNVSINIRPYRYPPTQKDTIEAMIKELPDSGVVRPSNSPFSYPIIMVKKKDGSWRMCIDYKHLNKNTVKDKFPILAIEELINELHGAMVFSKLDLRSGYHQIRMSEQDIYKTAFRSHEGHYKFVVMPFGLTNASFTFQALMNSVFKPLLRKFTLVFFDDILVYSPKRSEHIQHLRQVLSEVSLVSQATTEAQAAFEMLKQAMIQSPVLALPNFEEEFVIETDASGFGIGAVLQQNKHPIAYLSKTLAPRHQSLSTYEKELLAVILVLQKWKGYLLDKHFKIRTDHFSLKYVLDQRLTTPFQSKWLPKLLGFDHEIECKKETDNAAADVLSRIERQGKLFSMLTGVSNELMHVVVVTWSTDLILAEITEIVNKGLETYLRCMTGKKPKDWAKWISLAEFWYNTNFHTSIGTTPYEIVYGQTPPLHIPYVAKDSPVVAREAALQLLKFNLKRAQDWMKSQADKKRPEIFKSCDEEGFIAAQPFKLLERKLVKQNNRMMVYGLIQWSNAYEEDATWEKLEDIVSSMTPELHRQFENSSPYEMLQELKSMFKKQAGVERLDLIQTFYAYLSIGLIMNGLISDFVGSVRNYNMHNTRTTIGELHALLIEYEKGLPKKAATPQVMAIQGGRIQKANKKSLKGKGKGKGKGKDKHGDEYISQEFKDYLKAYGIVQQLTPPYTSQHNDVSKRRNLTLLDMVRSMMNLTTLPLSFWDYALESATCILDMVLTKKVDKTPYELCSRIYMEVKGFEPPQEEVVPVCRSARTHRAPDRLCLNVEVEEHSLRDLNEPTNYKAALLNSESDKAIRILVAIAAFYDYKIWQIDVKTAFLNGYIDEDINMVQPEGFIDPKYPLKLCKLQRLIYGLKQASKSWNKRFDEEIKRFGGEAALILRFKIYRDRSKRLIRLSQSAYMDKILKIFKMDISKRGNIHMQERFDLNKIQGASTPKEVKRMQNVPYTSAVGSIMYAVRCTRHDVAFAQNITSRFQQNLGEPHWTAVKTILKYLRILKICSWFMVEIMKLNFELIAIAMLDVRLIEMALNLRQYTFSFLMEAKFLCCFGEYSQWSERFMDYLEEQTDGETMINSIKNGDQPLPTVTQVSIAGATSSKQHPLKDKSMCNKTAKDLWDALKRHMLGSEYGEHDRKATVLYCELNFKFLNNLQPEWKQYATMMRQNKNLLDINIDALYNILKQNQGDVNDAMKSKKKAVVITSDPLTLVSHPQTGTGRNTCSEA
uniref:Putative polyprotein n=1 Tax=Tanacetum cinerariifolium TaxID=118510 RepID=A0A6L2LN92_TANCI|nr:putative polyprotein [Tanacetum cinerariifolium]